MILISEEMDNIYIRNPSFSVKIPYWKTFHFEAGKLVGESRPTAFKGLAHYDKNGKFLGKTLRNTFGGLVHYDRYGNLSGYSDYKSRNTIVHMSVNGLLKRQTLCIFGVLHIHRKTFGDPR